VKKKNNSERSAPSELLQKNQTKSFIQRLISYKIPVPFFVLYALILIGVYLAFKQLPEEASLSTLSNAKEIQQNHYQFIRNNHYQYTKPLLLSEINNESQTFQSLKNEINSFATTLPNTSISVFVLNFNTDEWFALNDQEKFKPGSMLKIVKLISILKQSEKIPGILESKVNYSAKIVDAFQHFESKELPLGKNYTVNELLYAMIVDSDNNATKLLDKFMDFNEYKQLFNDLNLDAPSSERNDYVISAKELSRFMRLLYNSTYLNQENSEKALKLLCQSAFKKGLVKELPNGTLVAHKFGEQFTPNSNELHETGIVYGPNGNYLITVMTR
jgi:beta-lactamase class A